jgi:bifunctional enzyme CysN/CysC
VDDGKSTLIGHLLHLTGNLFDDHLRVLEEESTRLGRTGGGFDRERSANPPPCAESGSADKCAPFSAGKPRPAGGELDYSLLLDGLAAEREQGITIDVAYRYFTAGGRKFIVADAPGHEQYTRNMATGASQCSAALILIDVSRGVLPQTRRHGLICALMGIRHLLFAVNKMDLVGWAEHAFRQVETQCDQIARELGQFGISLLEHCAVPVSALLGDGLVASSPHMPWYGGSTVMEWLQGVKPWGDPDGAAARLPVQYVIRATRPHASRQGGAEGTNGDGTIHRSYAGTVVSGRFTKGGPVAVVPSGLRTTIEGIWCGSRETDEAACGMAVSLTLEGEHDIVRGEIIVPEDRMPEVAHVFKVQLVWMGDHPLYAGRRYLFKALGGFTTAEILRIRDRIDLTSYQRLAADHFSLNDIGEAEIALSRPVPFDPYAKNRETGGFILIDRLSNATVACGMILHALRRSNNVSWEVGEIERMERAAIKGQKPCVLWFTGLSGAGKSTIANCLERKLHRLGRHTMLLDGDNIRQGLNRDLGFTEAGRIENIRRVGEVAKLMTDAGLIVITAFISPFRSEREMVRRLLPHGEFIEVYVSTPLDECERRDPKKLYRKARKGEIPNFTGIGSPYEAPETPEINLDAAVCPADESADAVLRYLSDHGLL